MNKSEAGATKEDACTHGGFGPPDADVFAVRFARVGAGGHIVHLILEAAEQIPTTDFRLNTRGSGSEQYPPSMMLALLIYSYATGRFGSRTIEAASYSDVAVRYLCANHHPDHSSICEFRSANERAFKAAFVTVLQLAQQLHLAKVGTVSIDGTKIQANASKHAAVSCARAGEMIAQLELEVQELMTRAQQAENQETKEPLDLPAELLRHEDRKTALQQARAVIEARAQELAHAPGRNARSEGPIQLHRSGQSHHEGRQRPALRAKLQRAGRRG